MDQPKLPDQQAFESLAQDARITRTARMLADDARLQPNQRDDIVARFAEFCERFGYTQAAVAKELNLKSSTFSDIVRLTYKGGTLDRHLVCLHNWMELAARRENLLRKKTFVDISVAREIMTVAGTVADTCTMGVIFGPARIGKTMTLQAICDEPRFGFPKLVRIDESMTRPSQLGRAIADAFEVPTRGTFSELFRRLIAKQTNTKRMLMVDEVDRCSYRMLELIRDFHDQTGCPVLLCGKPKIFEKLGFRHVGDLAEVTDQLAGRIVLRRDLTERTRGENPEPLHTLDDIRKLIHSADLKLKVTREAERWLQMRACALGTGGIGTALVCLYLAYKTAYAEGAEAISADHLDRVEVLTMGADSAQYVSEVVADSSGRRRTA